MDENKQSMGERPAQSHLCMLKFLYKFSEEFPLTMLVPKWGRKHLGVLGRDMLWMVKYNAFGRGSVLNLIASVWETCP